MEGPLAFTAFLALAALLCEADAVVADAPAFFAALAFERFHTARAGFGEAVRMFMAKGCGMARMSALAWSEKRSASSGFPVLANLFHGEAQIGNHFFERNALVASEPLFGGGDGACFFFTLRLVVDGRMADRDIFGVGQNFEQTDHGVELPRIEPVEQLMGMLFVHAILLYRLSTSGTRCARRPLRTSLARLIPEATGIDSIT